MRTIMTSDGLLILADTEYQAALHRGETITKNRHTLRARLAFRVAGYLTCLPYSKRLSLLVDRLIVYAENRK